MPFVTFLAAAALAAQAASTTPQDPRPPAVEERIVVTATAAPASATALGRAVTIVTRGDIERFAGGSIADALRLVPGADVRARGEKGVQADFVIRGASFGQALVLVDGMRLNDAQSGHHNADFPVSAASIDRIEVVTGGASSAHGADAFGGVINIVTREGRYREMSAAAGSFSSARAEAAAGWAPLALSAAAWGSRSGGFMFDRDFATGGARVALAPLDGARLSVSHARKAFGANGFYGPSPSKEWTDQTMATVSVGRTGGGWAVDARAAYRNHGDRFRWDIARPGFAENVHRTDAIDGAVRVDRLMGGSRVTFGATGGADGIDSSNLGDHDQARGAAFLEAHLPLASRIVLQPAVRVDSYTTFGTAVSPSAAMSIRVAESWRARASAGRAFRVPTFTERFYTDPNHAARDALNPEDGWTLEAGADWQQRHWSASATVFRRWDRDVIDWVRASAAERWRTTNVHDVDTRGGDLLLTRAFAGGGFVRVSYALADSRAPELALLSKYVLDYTRHAAGAQVALPLPGRMEISLRADGRVRSDDQKYTLIDARISHRTKVVTVFVEGANLLAERYTEISGVEMPGRSTMAGLTIRP